MGLLCWPAPGFACFYLTGVSITKACNYDFLGCYSRGRPDQGELSKAELNNLFSETQNMGFLAAVLTGGEPLNYTFDEMG